MVNSFFTEVLQNSKVDPEDVNQIPSGILAYMGDSLYEIIIRNFFVQRKYWNSHKLHQQAVKYVNAGAQATIFRAIEEQLTEKERGVFRRGRNSNAGNVPRNANVSDYRYSTGFEALLGYLYFVGDLERLAEIIELIEDYLEKNISAE